MASCKYYKQVRQVSYDSGVTWISLDEYQKGDLYENDSPDCGGGITQYKWVNVSGEYTCVGTTKYQKTKKQQSTDGGQTWTDVNPPEYNTGAVIAYNSQDCIGGNTKLSLTYSNGQSYSKECDGSSTLTSVDTKPSGYDSTIMTSAVIGNCVAIIGHDTFQWCTSLTSVTIPNSVTTIMEHAFGVTSIRNVTIPYSVTSIGWNPFNTCEALTSITVDSSNSYYSSLNGVLFNKAQTSLVSYPCGRSGSYTIPSGVTIIETEAFLNCKITSVSIPNTVTTLDAYCFSGCWGLKSITIPSSVTYIDAAFTECYYLKKLTCNATTPPTLTQDSLLNTPIADGNGYIYVPRTSVSTYKSASGWSEYSSRIRAIS